jgi:hypothetical protein
VTTNDGIAALDAESGAVEFRASWPEDASQRTRINGSLVRTFTASRTLVVATTDARIVTFDASSGALHSVASVQAPNEAVRFGASSDVLFLQDDRGWRAVEARTGRAVANPPPEPACPIDFRLPVEADERASALAVSEDGQRLLMGTNAGSLLLFAR